MNKFIRLFYKFLSIDTNLIFGNVRPGQKVYGQNN